MSTNDGSEAPVATFPVVGTGIDEAETLTAVIRRLSSARSLAEIMAVTTHAARILLDADGVTFVLREGELCHYADEDAIAPLWKGRRFPMDSCISGWCMREGKPVAIEDISKDSRIPQDAYLPTFVRSLAMAPVRQKQAVAAIGAYWAEPHLATRNELDRLQTIANAAALAISQVQVSRSADLASPAAGSGLVAEASLAQAVLDALSASVAVIDEHGTIVAVNEAWRGFARGNGAAHPEAFVGDNYLAVCAAAAGADAQAATSAREGIEQVLRGDSGEFRVEYPCDAPDKRRWFELRVTRFERDGRNFAVAAHEDVTERRLSEESSRAHGALLDALLEHVPEGITIASAPDVVIERVSAYGLRRMQRLEDEVAHIAAEAHPAAWQVYDRACTRVLEPNELPLTRATRAGEIVENEELCLRLPDGQFLPILCNAGPIRAADGTITGGVIAWRDITERKRADEGRQLLLRELNHRVKNLFSIMLGVITRTARGAASTADLAEALTGRLLALAKAHELIRPAISHDSEARFEGSLAQFVRAVVGPHLLRPDQLQLTGPEIPVGPDASVNLALLLHELATNASKHGALSKPEGAVAVDWREEEGLLALKWSESGGPPVTGRPDRTGFGSELARRCVEGQFGGSITFDWRPEGLSAELKLQQARLSA